MFNWGSLSCDDQSDFFNKVRECLMHIGDVTMVRVTDVNSSWPDQEDVSTLTSVRNRSKKEITSSTSHCGKYQTRTGCYPQYLKLFNVPVSRLNVSMPISSSWHLLTLLINIGKKGTYNDKWWLDPNRGEVADVDWFMPLSDAAASKYFSLWITVMQNRCKF